MIRACNVTRRVERVEAGEAEITRDLITEFFQYGEYPSGTDNRLGFVGLNPRADFFRFNIRFWQDRDAFARWNGGLIKEEGGRKHFMADAAWSVVHDQADAAIAAGEDGIEDFIQHLQVVRTRTVEKGIHQTVAGRGGAKAAEIEFDAPGSAGERADHDSLDAASDQDVAQATRRHLERMKKEQVDSEAGFACLFPGAFNQLVNEGGLQLFRTDFRNENSQSSGLAFGARFSQMFHQLDHHRIAAVAHLPSNLLDLQPFGRRDLRMIPEREGYGGNGDSGSAGDIALADVMRRHFRFGGKLLTFERFSGYTVNLRSSRDRIGRLGSVAFTDRRDRDLFCHRPPAVLPSCQSKSRHAVAVDDFEPFSARKERADFRDIFLPDFVDLGGRKLGDAPGKAGAVGTGDIDNLTSPELALDGGDAFGEEAASLLY